MVALRMYIEDLVVFLHAWLKLPSLQIQSNVKEIDNLLVDSNKVKSEAIFSEDFVKFFPCVLSLSGSKRGCH